VRHRLRAELLARRTDLVSRPAGRPTARPTARQLEDWGLDPTWSRVVDVTTADGRGVSWHILDNGAEPVHGTLVCTHGNPTWSYIWHEVLAQAPEGWRVVAVDQTGMGFSDRGSPRVLAERIDELVAFCEAHTSGPIVMAAHDWGGPITIGAAARLDCRALVLTNTGVALPDGVRMPPLIAAARSAVRVVCERTPLFVEGTARMTRREHRPALRAPYRTSARRHAVAEFVADIPVSPTDPSWTALEGVARDLEAVTCPVLLAFGGRDPVFHERFLADLVRRVPHADVQIFPEAAHLVTLDAPVAEVAWEWLAALDGKTEEPAEPESAPAGPDAAFRPVTAALVEHSSDPAVAFRGPGGTRSWQELAAHAQHIGAALIDDGLVPGDRVALLVPPSADCLAAAYGVWMAGGVVVAVDSQLGLRPMRRLMRAATVQWSIGTAKTVRLAKVVGLTPGARFVVVPELGASGGSVRPLPVLDAAAIAAVVHTSGATGPAKPVAYTHGALASQRDVILGQFPMGAFTTSFAPFMLVGPSLGLSCSLPADVTPGAMDFDAFALASRGTTTAWLSPAAAHRIIETAAGRTAAMDLVMLAGAPVPARLVEGMQAVTGADVRTPYGMTEALPITDGTTPTATGAHGGTCTGRPLDGVEVVIDDLSEPGDPERPGAAWGEILVSAAWMRAGYDRRWALNRDTTTMIGGRPFHRTGDVGYVDDQGRIFQLGRRMHVIDTAAGPLACVVPEQEVLTATGRTAAAVGVGPIGAQVLVVVLDADTGLELADLAATATVRSACAEPVAAVLSGRLPVDVRHRTKLDRFSLAADATSLLAGR
jgi:acyl-CoA synthetase (AMP-forming)/AMP-acid ligase II/pimeloyl-ACP methyl ester carboxylesterase